MNATFIARHNLHVLGNPDAGETLIFAHGYGSDQRAWRFIIPFFEKKYRIILYDLAGCGQSDPASYDYSRHNILEGYADDLIAICNSLSTPNPPTLITHSVSGMIGTLAANKRPGLFKRMVFIGASPRYLNDGEYTGGFTNEAIAELLTLISTNYINWIHGFAPAAMNSPEQPLLSDEFAASLLAMYPAVSLGIAKTIFLSDHRTEVARLDMPLLILQAHDDLAVPDQVGEYLHRAVRNSRLHWISTKGHFPHMSNPVEVTQAISDYLDL